MSDQEQGKYTAELFGSDRMWGLKELSVPEPVSWWPQTTGWYIVFAIALAALGWIILKQYQRYQHNQYRRDAFAQLKIMESEPAKIGELPFLLRRAALSATARTDVAGLRGNDWIEWLNTSAGKELFREEDARALDDLVYADEAKGELGAAMRGHLIKASKTWMKVHHAAV